MGWKERGKNGALNSPDGLSPGMAHRHSAQFSRAFCIFTCPVSETVTVL